MSARLALTLLVNSTSSAINFSITPMEAHDMMLSVESTDRLCTILVKNPKLYLFLSNQAELNADKTIRHPLSPSRAGAHTDNACIFK